MMPGLDLILLWPGCSPAYLENRTINVCVSSIVVGGVFGESGYGLAGPYFGSDLI